MMAILRIGRVMGKQSKEYCRSCREPARKQTAACPRLILLEPRLKCLDRSAAIAALEGQKIQYVSMFCADWSGFPACLYNRPSLRHRGRGIYHLKNI